ncbi:MAG: helix-turn-helix domain-containing protein [Gaiellaceae bacterium]
MGSATGTRAPSRRRGADFGVRDDVGSRIRSHREESNLSLRELARRLGISPSAVSQIETGKSRPSVNTLYAVIDELSLSVDDLFSPMGPAAAPGSAGAAVATSRRWPVGLELREDVGRRIRAHREETNLSLRELARRLGISPSSMSQIETGKSRPSVSTLYAVIDELGLAVDALFGPIGPARVPAKPETRTSSRSQAAAGGTVQRRKTRAAIEIESGVRWERLTPGPDDSLEFVHMTYGVGGASTPDDRFGSHPGREYGVVIHGTLEVGLGFDTYRLEAGDSIRFESTVPHLIRNVGREPATCIWCVVGEREGDEPRTVS